MFVTLSRKTTFNSPAGLNEGRTVYPALTREKSQSLRDTERTIRNNLSSRERLLHIGNCHVRAGLCGRAQNDCSDEDKQLGKHLGCEARESGRCVRHVCFIPAGSFLGATVLCVRICPCDRTTASGAVHGRPVVLLSQACARCDGTWTPLEKVPSGGREGLTDDLQCGWVRAPARCGRPVAGFALGVYGPCWGGRAGDRIHDGLPSEHVLRVLLDGPSCVGYSMGLRLRDPPRHCGIVIGQEREGRSGECWMARDEDHLQNFGIRPAAVMALGGPCPDAIECSTARDESGSQTFLHSYR